MTENNDIRAWLFRALAFETEADEFRLAGIRVGASVNESSDDELSEILAPFAVSMRTDAIANSRLFAIIFCFENSVRKLVEQRLEETHGTDWWTKCVAGSVRSAAEKVKSNAVSNAWLDGVTVGMVSFLTFGQLKKVIIDNWTDFEDLIPTQSWLNQKMDEIESVRNYVAHSRKVSTRELERLLLYMADWNQQVGF
jgi:hypothetical protein